MWRAHERISNSWYRDVLSNNTEQTRGVYRRQRTLKSAFLLLSSGIRGIRGRRARARALSCRHTEASAHVVNETAQQGTYKAIFPLMPARPPRLCPTSVGCGSSARLTQRACTMWRHRKSRSKDCEFSRSGSEHIMHVCLPEARPSDGYTSVTKRTGRTAQEEACCLTLVQRLREVRGVSI